MSKFFQRSIRINGEAVRSPRFEVKKEADQWYDQKKHERDSMFKSYNVKLDDKTRLFDYFHAKDGWLDKRKKKYPASTWKPDEQRFRDYIKPVLGHLVVSKINPLQVRKCLADVVDKHGMTIETRNRVRALLSKIFSDAMNDPKQPLRMNNPALNITFNDPLTGKKEPKFIAREKDIIKYITKAKELGPDHLAFAAIAIMAGLRKQEIIPLTWGDIDFDACEIHVRRKFIQAENAIFEGTKAGSNETRVVPISDDLVKILRKHLAKSDFQNDSEYVLSRPDGKYYGPREISTMSDSIRKLSGIDVTPHGLRHTYGRMFALKSGNLKALQALLGHASSTTTELYSKLAGKHVSKFRNTVSFGVDEDEND